MPGLPMTLKFVHLSINLEEKMYFLRLHLRPSCQLYNYEHSKFSVYQSHLFPTLAKLACCAIGTRILGLQCAFSVVVKSDMPFYAARPLPQVVSGYGRVPGGLQRRPGVSKLVWGRRAGWAELGRAGEEQGGDWGAEGVCQGWKGGSISGAASTNILSHVPALIHLPESCQTCTNSGDL